MAFFGELLRVHFGGRRHPQFHGDVALAFQQFGRCTEVTDVGHARTNEHLVDLGAGHIAQGLGVIGVVGAAHDGLFDLAQIDLDHLGVLGVFVGLQELRVGQPSLHGLDAAADGSGVCIALGDHVFQQHDVAVDVLDHWLFVQVHGTTGGAALGRSVGQLKGLLHLQIGQAFDFQNAARENVFLALFLNGEQPFFDRVQRNGVHQITQCDAGLHLAFEAHQDALGHVQWHHAGGCGKGHQTRTRWEADTHWEAGVAVATRAHGVGQEHAVEPRVNDAVARLQADAAAVADELRQFVVRLHVNGFGVGRGVAKRLHHQIGAKAQTRQVFQLVAGHGAGGVL